MNLLALRGLRERAARTAFTLLAVVLGVALIAGTFVLTDTISKSFDKLVATAGENVDVRVLSRTSGDASDGSTASLTFPATVEPRVRAVDGVAAASGAFRELSVTVVDARGQRVGPTQGAPTLAFSAVPERFDTFDYEGRAPRTNDEIAISTKAAEDAGVTVGDTLRVQGTQKIRPYTVVGHHELRRRRLARRRGVHRAHAARGPGPRRGAGQAHRHRRAGRCRDHAGRAQAPRQCTDRAGRPHPDGRRRLGATVQGPRRHPEVPHDRAARLRPHRPAGGRVRDLQHLHDHRRPAHAGVRDVAHDRRLAEAGAVGSGARGAPDRDRGLRAGSVRRDRACAPADEPARPDRVRAAEHRARDHRSHHRDRGPRGHPGDAPVQPGSGAARHARLARGGDERPRDHPLEDEAPRRPGAAARGDGPWPGADARRPVRRPGHRAGTRAAGRRGGGRLRRRGHALAVRRGPARGTDRVAAGGDRRRFGPDRTRQRRALAQPYRRYGRRADGRRGPGRLRGHLRQRLQGLVLGRLREDVHRRLRDPRSIRLDPGGRRARGGATRARRRRREPPCGPRHAPVGRHRQPLRARPATRVEGGQDRLGRRVQRRAARARTERHDARSRLGERALPASRLDRGGAQRPT